MVEKFDGVEGVPVKVWSKWTSLEVCGVPVW